MYEGERPGKSFYDQMSLEVGGGGAPILVSECTIGECKSTPRQKDANIDLGCLI